MLIVLDTLDLPGSLIQSVSEFSSQISFTHKKTSLTLKEVYGAGHFKSVVFDGDIVLFQISCKTHQAVTFRLDANNGNFLCFFFCLQGKPIFAKSDNANFERVIAPLDGCISSIIPDNPLQIKIPAKKETRCVLIIVDKKKLLRKAEWEDLQLSSALQRLFLQSHNNHGYFRLLPKNSEILQITNKLFSSDQNPLSGALALEASVLQMLSWQMHQLDAEENGHGDLVNMNRYNLERIVEARQVLLSDLQKPPTIKELSRRVGINEHKLKNGFKEVFKTTIYQCLLETRFKKAQAHLEEGRLNISQIAEKLGYTNKSHFTNKFKSFYGVLPKDFMKGICANKKTEISAPGD